MKFTTAACAVLMALPCEASPAADSPPPPQPVLAAPPGFAVELVAGPPLVQRPIVGALDDQGRLYVAESSGSNDPVQKQLEERPHRIVRLEDADGDGKFDKRTVFADRMMFPAGTMFLDGSLYVAAPPSIWKLTDRDCDGVADERSEWFQGKTLTGCANDLHGPYLGPDGWIYWCKGAFAEQTHVVNGQPWTTRAAHIFRCRPDGTGLEPVMTGGMDNPIDVAFTPDGERILSATIIVGQGRRDGIIHAIYGGVYGKQHGVLDGHPRTGELMPALAPMPPVAPSGLERYDNDAFGEEYRDNFFMCQFNMRKVSRHALRSAGSTFVSEDSDFVTSDAVDFHPTDVLVDADGSLLVIDTGGWYKLCCPTSQLWKPDVLGDIHRVRRIGAKPPDDPRGLRIAWSELDLSQIWSLLCDARSAVRGRATREFVSRRRSSPMEQFLAGVASRGAIQAVGLQPSQLPGGARMCDARTWALARTWVLVSLEGAQSQSLVRELLQHPDEQVRHAALHSISLQRDALAVARLLEILASDTPANRRAAAEALGRLDNSSAVPALLAAAADAGDRILQHSITYALIELADPAATRGGLDNAAPGTVATALVALDQMHGGGVTPDDVVPRLSAQDEKLRDAARWLVSRHPEWDNQLTGWFRQELAACSDHVASGNGKQVEASLESMLQAFAAQPGVERMLAETIEQEDASTTARRLALRVIAQSRRGQPLPRWYAALSAVIAEGRPSLVPLAVETAKALAPHAARHAQLTAALLSLVDGKEYPDELRVNALAAVAGGLSALDDGRFALLVASVAPDKPASLRSAAMETISRAPLSSSQLQRLCEIIQTATPLELNRLLAPFERSADEQIGRQLLASLRQSTALASLRMDVLRVTLAKYGPSVQQAIDELEPLVNVDAASQRQRINELLPLTSQGDMRLGHALFHSAKAACAQCHRLGAVGGTVGPELTGVGAIRTERDLLESILFPNLSFVRSYETVQILTIDGQVHNGIIREETPTEYMLTIGHDQEVRVSRRDVEQIEPSTVSVMPTGLDQQLTVQEIAGLVAFLRNAKGQ